MRQFKGILSLVIIGAVTLSSCSTSQIASTSPSDNLYFMASDAQISSTYAVANNTPETFEQFEQAQTVPNESFSSRNVNPEYLAKYSATPEETGDEVVYFDDNTETQSTQGDIDAYNNFSVNNNNNSFNSGFNSGLAFSMGFMTGFNPWGFGMWDPFWGPSFGWGAGWGFRPGFSINIGFGFGSPFWGSPWGNPFYRPGWGGFYDPFWGPSYAWGGGWGPGWGMPIYGNRPIYVLPGGEFGDRRIVRGARPTRGASLAGVSGDRSNAVLPNTSRAQARRSAMSNRSLVSSDRSRVPARDFSNSQSDYYNSNRSRIANSSPRNTGSAAMNRSSATRSRSAMPTARPSTRTMDRSGYAPSRSMNNYNSRRSTSPSYNRSAIPSRSSSPSYNRGTTNRTYTQAAALALQVE
jgi:hypothetical protein